jgi:ABC-type tungstate transport system substrate-binding protein
MSFIIDVLGDGFSYLGNFNSELREIIVLTLFVSLTATVIATVLGVPAAVALAEARFRGRGIVMTLVNVGMGIPPVLAGLFVLLLVWGSGPLGSLDLVFTPAAMIIVQTLLALPIVIGLCVAAVSGLAPAAREQLAALRLGRLDRGKLLILEARAGAIAAVAAAFGRVVSEVGAVLIVGGNIAGETRVLTTAIVQESRQARFGAAIALGIVLLTISVVVNGTLTWLQGWDRNDG